MDNLPKGPPDSSNNNSTPPPFGSNFDPHTNPVDPNNPYSSQPLPVSQSPPPSYPQTPIPDSSNPAPNGAESNILENLDDPSKHIHYSEVAQHKPRDAHGHFLPYEHPTNSPNPSVSSNPSQSGTGLPPIIEINQNTQPSDKKDPPLFGFFLTNPVTYLRIFLNKLLKRQMITLRIPVLALIVIMVGVGGYGVGFKSGINYALGKLFPNFSPIFHRSITAQGTIQKSSKGYFLQTNDKEKTLWTLNPSSANVNLADYEGMKVQIKGNLTPTPNLIEVLEVISFDTKSTTPDIP